MPLFEKKQHTEYLFSRLSRAKYDGYAAVELQARLLLAKAELESGKRAAARFDKLQADAHSKGFLLIAREAGAALPRGH
ncbi:MAG: hypothetical protein LAP21_20335 [Acidobacteriia bacterium]|nr:hypothetical protein [Terriglobia bacterium]